MSKFSEVLALLRDKQPQAKYGIAFEKLMVNFFKTDPVLSAEFVEVCRWNDWQFNGGHPDTGIDIVARRRDDNRWVAIQAKFYDAARYIQKKDIDSFFEVSGRSFAGANGPEFFAHRYIISTTDRWSANAEAALENQQIPVSRIGVANIAASDIDWDVAFPGSEIQINLTRRKKFGPRPHQQAAIANVLKGFENHDRGQLIMACGTGKTFTALRLAEQVAHNNDGRARVLFLVPSISLLSQTLKEWTAQAQLDLRSYAVCSDSKVTKKAEDIAAYDLEVPVSTNGKSIAERFSSGKRFKALHVVFSTYQSLPAVHAAQQQGLADFDLVICDEAHRTTGVTLYGEDPSNFTRVHDADYIKAQKRLYMTATPRLYDEEVKGKAAEHSAEVMSMDDEAVFGPEFHRLGFGEAVEKGLLTDYKVLVMTVDEEAAAQALARGGGGEVNLSLASAMIGAWNALAKRSGREQGTKSGFAVGASPMQRTVAFAEDIKTSRAIAESYPYLIDSHRESLKEQAAFNNASMHNVDLEVAAEHVDGSMNAMERNTRLSWLESTMGDNETRVLTNARCLSEGVDVPALDAVIFFNPRRSMVDVVQSVGRVMRRSAGKDYGYIILPVAVPPDVSPSQALNDNKRFRVVWQILNALRAHDDRFNAQVNSIALNEGRVEDLPIEVEHIDDPRKQLEAVEQSQSAADSVYGVDGVELAGGADAAEFEMTKQIALFSLEQWQEAMYTKLVDKVGTRTYWEDWADDVAAIAQSQISRIRVLVAGADARLRREFELFVGGLRGNLNDSITEEDAISMLSQHLITAPVFAALFTDYDFTTHNPVAQVMQRMADALSDANLEAETEPLEKFYESVRVRASEVSSASGKQQVIKELYERFFQKAFKKQSEALGIVYTPVEIVDFILRAADDLSKKHFGKGLTDEGVCILDPFAGTSTFMVRLLQSGLIKPADMARKFAGELYATEIMLLAYYVSVVNIETTYNALKAEEAKRSGLPEPEYVPFDGIALADTFQIHEDGDILDLTVFKNNNERIERQKAAPINVIVGNPPYSAGQTSANDLNANLKYPTLDARIAQTYAAKSTAVNKNSLYDSYLRAFRWATDRIQDQGIVAFISNNGWLDGNTGDGVRLSMAEDFTDVYIVNLRGNSRTAGETAKKEGGNVFNIRVGVSILIGVKDPSKSDFTIHYAGLPDYSSKDDKLSFAKTQTPATIEWQNITPNEHGDWLNQRSADFATWPVIGEKKGSSTKFFETFSSGLKTGRDAWAYAQTPHILQSNLARLTHTYAEAAAALQGWLQQRGIIKSKEDDVTKFLQQYAEFADTAKISWNRTLKNLAAKSTPISVKPERVYRSLYRPFMGAYAYFDGSLNDMTYQLPSMFPTPQHDNIGILTVSPGETASTAALATTLLPDLHVLATSQFFPRFTWQKLAAVADDALFGAGLGKEMAGGGSYLLTAQLVSKSTAMCA